MWPKPVRVPGNSRTGRPSVNANQADGGDGRNSKSPSAQVASLPLQVRPGTSRWWYLGASPSAPGSLSGGAGLPRLISQQPQRLQAPSLLRSGLRFRRRRCSRASLPFPALTATPSPGGAASADAPGRGGSTAGRWARKEGTLGSRSPPTWRSPLRGGALQSHLVRPNFPDLHPREEAVNT